MADGYLQRLLRRAWRDTLVVHSIKRIAIGLLVAFVSALIWRYIDPDRAAWAAKAAAVTAIATVSAYPAVYLFEFLSAPAKLDVELREELAKLREAQTEAKAVLPRLMIEGITFDPNGPTEMYVDFEIANPGPPTTIDNWKLDVTFPDGRRTNNLLPRFIMGGKQVPGPFGGIRHSDFTEAPLETGERRRGCRLGFTVQGEAKEQFGVAGAQFDVSASDVRGNRISASLVLPS
jgi:hypothetical protein